jgi:hypothetical protein
MKKFLFWVLICFCLFFISCGRNVITSQEELGKILSADVVPTSFNECFKMKVVTEKKVVIIIGITSIDLNKRSWISYRKDGSRTFGWEGSDIEIFCR